MDMGVFIFHTCDSMGSAAKPAMIVVSRTDTKFTWWLSSASHPLMRVTPGAGRSTTRPLRSDQPEYLVGGSANDAEGGRPLRKLRGRRKLAGC